MLQFGISNEVIMKTGHIFKRFRKLKFPLLISSVRMNLSDEGLTLEMSP